MSDAVRVRMYDIGFGDCFLIFIPTSAGEKTILVDCGSIKKHKKSGAEIAARLIDDLPRGNAGGPRIDVVIATHRHRDHVSGFAEPVWSGVEVGEVWMPWTEHPTDPLADHIRERQSSLALHLTNALQGARGMGKYLDLAMNALSNERAMDTLHRGFAGQPRRRFLPGTDAPNDEIETDVLPGVTAYVLGPSRDPEIIRDMDPPAGQSYLQLVNADRPGQRNVPLPFGREWQCDGGRHGLSDKDKRLIRRIGAGLEKTVAVQLENAVNGTSLMLVFRVADTYFLFPGDAQWGTWDAAMKNPRWREILQKTTFYKVGHHGSHNATPTEFVEDPDGAILDCAMVPVTPRGNWDIPRAPLLDALSEVSDYGCVRSDDRNVSRWFTRNGDWWVEAEVPI